MWTCHSPTHHEAIINGYTVHIRKGNFIASLLSVNGHSAQVLLPNQFYGLIYGYDGEDMRVVIGHCGRTITMAKKAVLEMDFTSLNLSPVPTMVSDLDW